MSEQPKKPERTCRVLFRSEAGLTVKVCTPKGRRVVEEVYVLCPQPAEWGRAYRAVKTEGSHRDGEPSDYDVLLDGPHDSCECMGFLVRGSCRHLELIRRLEGVGAFEGVMLR